MQAVKILSGKGHAKQSFFKRVALSLFCYVFRTAIAFFCKGKHVLLPGNAFFGWQNKHKYCFAFLFSKGHAEGV